MNKQKIIIILHPMIISSTKFYMEAINEKVDVLLNYKNPNLNAHIKIFQFGDQQIEVVSNRHDRYDEYEYTNKKLESAIRKEQPDIVVITGDIFENGNRGTINSNEVGVFISLLGRILKAFEGIIIIINGNHEMQKSSNIQCLATDGKILAPIDEIDNVVNTLNNPRVNYYKYTDIYPKEVNGVVYNFIVHSHYNKQLPFLEQPYIYTEPTDPNVANVSLYHDATIGHSIGFDSKVHDKIGTVDIKSFDNVNSVLAGDIHAPQIHDIGTTPSGQPKIFAYSSSVTMRGFGEGDYYANDWCYQEGRKQHGYMVWELNNLGETVTCNFTAIEPCINRVTVNMTKLFDSLPLPIPSHVKIKSSLSSADTIIMKQRIEENTNCLSVKMEGNYEVVFNEEEQNFDEKSEFSKQELLEASLSFVDRIVDTSRGLDDKDKAKEILRDLVSESFKEILLTKPKKSLTFLNIEIYNFLGIREANVPLNKPLTTIRGTNGAGKSTVIKALSWCKSGKITGKERSNRKAYNLNRIRNYLNDDQMRVCTTSVLNGDTYVVDRVVTFEGKKPVETITITKNGSVETYEDAQEYLDQLFPFAEIKDIYQNIASLDLFLHQPSDKLQTEILRRVGIGAIEKLGENFSVVQDKYMEKFPNPEGKQTFYESKIATCTSEILSINDQVADNNKKHLEIFSEIDSLSEELKEFDEYLEDQEQQINKEIAQKYFSFQGRLESLNNDLDTINGKIDMYEGQDSFDRKLFDKYTEEVDGYVEGLPVIKTRLLSARTKHSDSIKKQGYWHTQGTDRKREISEEETESYNVIYVGQSKKIVEIEKSIHVLESEQEESVKSLSILEREYETYLNNSTQNKSLIQSEMYQTASRMQLDKLEELNEYYSKLEKEESSSQKGLDTHNRELDDVEKLIASETSKVEMYKNELCKNCGDPHGIETTELLKIEEHIVRLKADMDTKSSLVNDYVLVVHDTKKTETKNTITVLKDIVKSKQFDKIEAILGIITSDKIIELRNQSKELTQEINRRQAVLDKFLLVVHTDEINQLKLNKKTVETELEKINLKDMINKARTNDVSIQKISSEYKRVSESVVDHENLIAKYEEELLTTEDGLTKAQKLLTEQEKLSNLWLSRGDQKTLLENRKTEVLVEIKESAKEFETVTHSYNFNKRLEDKIKEVKETCNVLETKIKDGEEQITNLVHNNELLEVKITENENELGRCKNFIKQLDARSIGKKTMNLFKKIVSGNGLPLYVFNNIANIINKRMADMLEMFPFALRFANGELVKVDKRNGQVKELPIDHISGMEINMGALSLMEVIDSLNDEWNINLRFIDELSGQLSSGEDLKNKHAVDFRELYKKLLLSISQRKNLIVVDHVLTDIGDNSIEFLMGDFGGYHI